jgi:transmembrane sensor
MRKGLTSSAKDEAAMWVVRLHSDQRTRADEVGFKAWLERDPRHANAYADCVALWDDVGALSAKDEAQAILAPIRGRAVRSRRDFSRRGILVGGSVTLAAAAAAVAVGPLILNRDLVLSTVPGQQRSIRLADGSTVLLNTDTLLRVSLRANERRLILDRGQAWFQVAKDSARPFRVFVGDDEVRALGTEFEVRRIGDTLRVTLEEGKVAIYRAKRSLRPVRAMAAHAQISTLDVASATLLPTVVLKPGEQVDLSDTAPLVPVAVRDVDLTKSGAWRYGRMILDDAPLGETVADLNRYGGVRIILADPGLARIRVSGVFHTGQPQDFVDSITAAFPVRIASQDNETIVLAER